jgi:hypothetical protein
VQAPRLFATAAAFASIVCCFGACNRQPDERLAVIESSLREKAKEWTKADDVVEYPCVKLSVIKSIDIREQTVVMTIPISSVPAPLTPCADGKIKAYYQVYQPDISGEGASIFIDFHCGVMCGGGGTLFLDRTRSGWKVGETRSSWVS